MRHRSAVEVEDANQCAGRRIHHHIVHLDVTQRDHRVVGQRREPAPQPSDCGPEIPKRSAVGELAVDLVENCEIRSARKPQAARFLEGCSTQGRNLSAQITSQPAASFGERGVFLVTRG